MNFARMHNDYLDPDQHLTSEDYGFERVKNELKRLSSNRWRWDIIDYCMTGKDADLEPWGQQGLELSDVGETTAKAIAHIGKTFCGIDVCLNLPDDIDDQTRDEVLELYLEQATEIVCGCGVGGYWSGDDWYMSAEVPYSVPVVLTEDQTDIDPVKTAEALIDGMEKALANAQRELVLADKMLDVLSGWYTYSKRGKRKVYPEGKPCKGSVWDIYKYESKGKGAHE